MSLNKASTTARLVLALDSALATVREEWPEVPEIALVVGIDGKGKKHGHFAAERWSNGEDPVHEIALSGESLKRGAVATFGTLLHEVAHSIASVRKIQDTSRQGRFHNKKFKAIAEELGLLIEQDPQIGWSLTTVPDETQEKFAPQIERIEEALKVYRVPVLAASAPKTTVRIMCDCRAVTVPIKFFDEGGMICQLCDEEFSE